MDDNGRIDFEFSVPLTPLEERIRARQAEILRRQAKIERQRETLKVRWRLIAAQVDWLAQLKSKSKPKNL